MRFIRYTLIQLLAYVIDMGGFVIVLKFGFLGPVASNIVGKVAAGVFAFVAHRNFTFSTNDASDRTHQAVRYFFLLALNIPLSSSLLAALLIWIDHPAIAKVMADVVCVLLTYWLSKSHVFIKRRRLDKEHIDSKEANV